MTTTAMLERSWPEPDRLLVSRLSQPEAYAHRPARVLHLETHISHVFIAGDYAYKVKKPVDLGFIDYSTLEKRRVACEEEIRLNRRLAPDLYLAMVAISAACEGVCVEAPGAVIEYAVKMRAFAQHDLLHAALRRAELTARHIDRLASTLAAFHDGLSPAPLSNRWGTADEVMAPALQNFDQMDALVAEPEAREHLRTLRHWTSEAGGHLQSVFEHRRREGRIRECHGDLHLGNVVLIGGEPRVFDAIEFSATLRWIDVMSDVAFLAMDLACQHRLDLAWRFLNQYLESSGDYGAIAVLRFYLVYRAMVRAKVHALRAHQAGVTPRERAAAMARCRAHLDWALAHSTQRRPTLILLHGFSGSGKTSRSMTLLESLGAVRVRSDVERKRLHGVRQAEHRPGEVGTGLYGDAANSATYGRLIEAAQVALRAGYPVMVDATFLRRSQRDAFRELARRLSVPWVIADFRASPATLRARLEARAAAGTDASDADLRVLDRQLLTAEPLADDELAAVVVFDTEVLSQREIRDLGRHLVNVTRT